MTIKTTEILSLYLLVLINASSIVSLPTMNSVALIFFFLSTFCLLEYLHTVRYRKAHCFLVVSRTRYLQVVSLSLLEHSFSERYTFEWVKVFGFFLCMFGQIMRTAAEFTLQHDFNLNIRLERKKQKLCKTGIYRYLRHPSYTGSFYWDIGLQLILNNVLCLVLVVLVSGTFFYYRINFEEKKLERFYGKDYKQFKAETWVLIPPITFGDRLAMLLDKYRLFLFRHE